jgi:hypothetical protein
LDTPRRTPMPFEVTWLFSLGALWNKKRGFRDDCVTKKLIYS